MYELKLKISESQERILRPALKSLESSMFRFNTPSLVEGTLTIDPFDFAQLVTYMERKFENEMEIFRLKKTAAHKLAQKRDRCRNDNCYYGQECDGKKSFCLDSAVAEDRMTA